MGLPRPLLASSWSAEVLIIKPHLLLRISCLQHSLSKQFLYYFIYYFNIFKCHVPEITVLNKGEIWVIKTSWKSSWVDHKIKERTEETAAKKGKKKGRRENLRNRSLLLASFSGCHEVTLTTLKAFTLCVLSCDFQISEPQATIDTASVIFLYLWPGKKRFLPDIRLGWCEACGYTCKVCDILHMLYMVNMYIYGRML